MGTPPCLPTVSLTFRDVRKDGTLPEQEGTAMSLDDPRHPSYEIASTWATTRTNRQPYKEPPKGLLRLLADPGNAGESHKSLWDALSIRLGPPDCM